MEIAKDFRVCFMEKLDLLHQGDEQRLVVDVRSVGPVLLLLAVVFVVVVFIQLVLGARLVRPCAIIRCVHHVVRCVVDQQIVETEKAKRETEK